MSAYGFYSRTCLRGYSFPYTLVGCVLLSYRTSILVIIMTEPARTYKWKGHIKLDCQLVFFSVVEFHVGHRVLRRPVAGFWQTHVFRSDNGISAQTVSEELSERTNPSKIAEWYTEKSRYWSLEQKGNIRIINSQFPNLLTKELLYHTQSSCETDLLHIIEVCFF